MRVAWVLSLVAVCLSVAAFTLAVTEGETGEPGPTPTPTPTHQVEEDEPGWDCRVHGNKVCGPDVHEEG